MPTMNKTFENMQQLGREWGDYSRRMSRDALRAMSGQLETAARYLDDLSHRLDHQNGHAESTPNGHGDGDSQPSEHAN